MPVNDSFEYDYTPGFTKPTHEFGQPFGDEFHAEAVQELLLSTAGYTQRGVTLAGGQGVLPTGTVIARHSASGKWFQYQSGATDGRQTPLGILRDSRDSGGNGYSTVAAYNAAYLAAYPASSGTPTITLTGTATTYAASAAGKSITDCQGNLVYRGVLNANLVSGTDTSSIVTGTGGGVSAQTVTALGARVMAFGTPAVGTPAFPGGPMDGSPGTTQGVNAFIF
jgi:Bacteriophage lambda head decoration protein D